MSPDLSVIIPNYRRPDLVRTCLTSVLQARSASEHHVEVILVDDGSGDATAAIVEREFPEVRVIALPENRGYPSAINAGVNAARGPWVMTLNNDTTVAPDLFERLLDVARSSDDIGIVAAQQRFSSSRGTIYSAGMVMDTRGQASDRLMGRPAEESEPMPVEVFGACGAAALYRRAVLDELGLFDPVFRFGLEDADVSWRARAAGWRCLYAPDAIVYHDLGGTIAHGTSTRLYQAGRNRWLLIAKNLETRQLLLHLPQIILFDLAYVAYGILRLRSLAPLTGRVAGLRLWRQARASTQGRRAPVPLSPATHLTDVLRRRRAWSKAASKSHEVSPDWLNA